MPDAASQLSVPDLGTQLHVPITIVGLGPGDLRDLTLGAWQTLSAATRIVLRTARHPCVAALAGHFALESCDALYEQHDDFAAVYAAIAQRVLALAVEPGGVVYAVPGHPWVGEATTALILAQAQAAGLEVRIVGGISFIESVLAHLGLDGMNGVQVADAMTLASQHHPKVEPGQPLLIGQFYAEWLASDLKLTLMNAYPDEHEVVLIRTAGTANATIRRLPLYEMDRGDDFDHLTSLFVPPLPEGGSITDLQEIIAHLRAPEGCPWDREQTLESLRPGLLDEANEVLEAIDAEADGEDNTLHIAEELGDLLLLALMMVQIATEEGRFHLADVTHGIVTKLIRRHPHVFGDVELDSYDELFVNWDAIKAQERAEKGQAARGPLDGIPVALPALEKARKLQSKAEKAGLLQRASEAAALPQLAELLTAGQNAPLDEAQLGELLWRLVALAHEQDLNAENALRSYTVAYRNRHA